DGGTRASTGRWPGWRRASAPAGLTRLPVSQVASPIGSRHGLLRAAAVLAHPITGATGARPRVARSRRQPCASGFPTHRVAGPRERALGSLGLLPDRARFAARSARAMRPAAERSPPE